MQGKGEEKGSQVYQRDVLHFMIASRGRREKTGMSEVTRNRDRERSRALQVRKNKLGTRIEVKGRVIDSRFVCCWLRFV